MLPPRLVVSALHRADLRSVDVLAHPRLELVPGQQESLQLRRGLERKRQQPIEDRADRVDVGRLGLGREIVMEGFG